MPRGVFGWLCLAALGLNTGCSTTCDDPRDPILFAGGENPSPTSYRSSPLTGPWLHFPGGRAFDLKHNLPGIPNPPQAFLAFDEFPENSSQSAGNQVIIEASEHPESFIRVRNDSCAEFYLLVVAETPGGSDAGAD